MTTSLLAGFAAAALVVAAAPDWRGTPEQAGAAHILCESADAKGASEYLIYEWRGLHDYLCFPLHGDSAGEPGWWFAED